MKTGCPSCAGRKRRRPLLRCVLHVVAVAVGAAFLYGMVGQYAAWLAGDADAPGIWKLQAGTGLGVAGLAVLLLVHDTLRHRLGGPAEWWDAGDLPATVTFKYSRFFAPCATIGSAGVAFFCAGAAIDALLPGGTGDDSGVKPIFALPLGALFLLILTVHLRRLDRNPGRALVVGTMTLDAEGIVLDGWHRTKIAWADIDSVRRVTSGTSGIPCLPHDYLFIKPRDPAAYRSAAQWDSLMQRLTRPIFGMRSRSCCIFAAVEAFLERAQRERAAKQPQPSPSQ